MTFSKGGFLSEESDVIRHHIKSKFSEQFALAYEINCYAHDLLGKLLISRELPHLVGVTLFIRVVNSFAATIRLLEFGIGHEAGGALRSAVEGTIFLKKISVHPEWSEYYVKVSEFFRKKFVNVVINNPSDFKLGKINIDDLNRLKAELDENAEKEKLSEINVEAIAREEKVGLSGMYNNAHRWLSNNCLHVSPHSINSFVRTDGDRIVGIHHEPILDDVNLLIATNCITVAIAMKCIIEIFKVEKDKADFFEEKIESILTKFNR